MTAAATELHSTPAPKAAARQALGTTVNIPPRRLDFEFKAEQYSRYFYGNDPFLSSFWNTFSSLLPQGEFFFVQAVRHYRDKITDPTLKAQVAGFIGQEAMHSKEHDTYTYYADTHKLESVMISDFGGDNSGYDGMYGAMV